MLKIQGKTIDQHKQQAYTQGMTDAYLSVVSQLVQAHSDLYHTGIQIATENRHYRLAEEVRLQTEAEAARLQAEAEAARLQAEAEAARLQAETDDLNG